MRCRPASLFLTVLLGALLLVPDAAPVVTGAAPTPFRAWDVVIETGDQALAAWQVAVRLAPGSVLAGVEGGSAPAFAEPPYHDPAALAGGRVVLAAFSTRPAAELPRGAVRVARLHVRAGDEPASHAARLTAAAGPDGARIPARVTLHPVES
jgi:hypothetical protein